MDTPGVIQLIVLFVLVFLSGFFSSAETALTTANQVRLRSLADEGDKRALLAGKILDQHGKMLSAILIGNNIVNLSASALAATLAMRIHLAVGIATGILTFVILICGEIVPKTAAMLSADKLALRYAGLVYGLMQFFTPLIFICDIFSAGILRLLQINPGKRISTMTEEDLKTYLDVSHEDGVIETNEREMINNVFDFSDAVARDIMIPRIDMETVSIDATYDEVLAMFRQSFYTRLPVYRDDPDDIIGLVNMKDFFLTENTQEFRVENIMRLPLYTHELKKVSTLLLELREQTTSLICVVDEYGATVGMLTVEDILEELVGQIRDEYDKDEDELIQEKGAGTYLIAANMKLDDVNDELGTDLQSEDYDSLGGILIESLNRLPKDGEEVLLENGIRLQAQGIEQNRVVKVLLTFPEPEVPPADQGTETGPTS